MDAPKRGRRADRRDTGALITSNPASCTLFRVFLSHLMLIGPRKGEQEGGAGPRYRIQSGLKGGEKQR